MWRIAYRHFPLTLNPRQYSITSMRGVVHYACGNGLVGCVWEGGGELRVSVLVAPPLYLVK